MRSKAILAAAAGALIVAPALAQSPSPAGKAAPQPAQPIPSQQQMQQPAQPGQQTQHDSQQTTGLAPASGLTEMFVQRVAISDMFEIESSRIAADKASEPVQAYANHMIDAHGKTSNELKSLLQSVKIQAQPPTQMDDLQKEKLDTLRGLAGAELDFAYKNMQLQAHRDAIVLFTSYAEAGDNPELKDWAAKTLPKLKEHFEMAQGLGG